MSGSIQAPPGGGNAAAGAQDQLLQLLSQLSHNIQDNTRVLRRLEASQDTGKQGGKKDKTSLDERSDKVKISILRGGEKDACDECDTLCSMFMEDKHCSVLMALFKEKVPAIVYTSMNIKT